MAHLYTTYRCNCCGEIPDSAPMYFCPRNHHYCYPCFQKLQKLYRGNSEGAGCCLVCKYIGNFSISDVTTNILRKLRTPPGIGRPCRYPKKLVKLEKDASKIVSGPSPAQSFSGPFMEPKFSRGDFFMSRSAVSQSCVGTVSKRPIICLHDNCRKSVAVSTLASHFKYDHTDVITWFIEKGHTLSVTLDPTLMEYDRSYCVGMITVFEINKLDEISSSTSSQNVVNACNKFAGKVPINTFWLMLSASSDNRKSTSFVILWLYSNSEDTYTCNLELFSKNNGISVSTFCNTVGLHQSHNIDDICKSMNCLYLTRGSLVALLGEGEKVPFNITVE